MKLPQSLSHLVDQTRSLGPGRVARFAPGWLLRREYTVLVRNLLASLPNLPPGGSSVLREIRESDIAEIERMGSMTAREARRRWKEGHEGFLWWVDNQPAHYYWVTRRAVWLPYVARTFRPQPGDVCVLDVFTRPEFRGRGIDTRSSVDYLHRAHAAGLQRLIALVAPWNAPALHVAERRMGAVPVGSIGVRNFLVTRRHFATGLVRLEGSDGFHVLPGVPGP
jgi:RimJ/RimL family protein N-acetyltransferase